MTLLINWDCPKCGETNTDIPNQTTHCDKCGRVVFVMDEDDLFDDMHYNVDITEAHIDCRAAGNGG